MSCLSLDSVIRATPQPRLTTTVTIKCAGRATLVSLMVDTGADISTVQESTVALLVASVHVQPTSTIISNFDGSTITQLCGTLEATVVHDKTRKRAQTTLYVVPDNLPAVAGRDLIQALSLPVTSADLRWQTLQQVLALYTTHSKMDVRRHGTNSSRTESRRFKAAPNSSQSQPSRAHIPAQVSH